MIPVGGQARNYRETNFPHREPQDDLNPLHPWVHDCKRRRVRLKDLIVRVAVSPRAQDDTFTEVQQTWARIREYNLPIEQDMKSSLTPTVDELKQRGWGEPGQQ